MRYGIRKLRRRQRIRLRRNIPPCRPICVQLVESCPFTVYLRKVFPVGKLRGNILLIFIIGVCMRIIPFPTAKIVIVAFRQFEAKKHARRVLRKSNVLHFRIYVDDFGRIRSRTCCMRHKMNPHNRQNRHQNCHT